MSREPSPWNSLEVAKLCVSSALALAILLLGSSLQSQQIKAASAAARTSQFIQKRTDVWDQLVPLLARTNLLLDQTQPSQDGKRELADLSRRSSEIVIAYQLYFTLDFVNAYEGYADIVEDIVDGEKQWQGAGRDLWSRYKCLRRTAARDIGIPVDARLVALETGSGDSGDPLRGCAGHNVA
jgi:hypothetical protein